MTKMQRVKQVLSALLMMGCCFILIKEPELGYAIVAMILSVSLLLYAIRCLIYYFTMARHMVGGRSVLYTGIILLDLAVFTMANCITGLEFRGIHWDKFPSLGVPSITGLGEL